MRRKRLKPVICCDAKYVYKEVTNGKPMWSMVEYRCSKCCKVLLQKVWNHAEKTGYEWTPEKGVLEGY